MTGLPGPIAVVGATATGKSALAMEVAVRVGGEIISMDSRQVYRGMDIGTAKASRDDQAVVPHHVLDLVVPDERFNAGRFADYARACISRIQACGATPILAGGTGFFLRALTNPIFQEPPLDPGKRASLESYLACLGDDELRRWLRALDPESGERLKSWGGRQRLLRALELPLLTGRSLTWWHIHAPARHPPLCPLTFVVEVPWEILEVRIDVRLDAMLRQGLVEEVASLMQMGYSESSPGMNATGYIEVVRHLRGEMSLDEAIAQIRRNTRAFARRQLTWFRNQLPGRAIALDGLRPAAELADEVVGRMLLRPEQSVQP